MMGAEPTADGVRYCTWAPDSERVAVVIDSGSQTRELAMSPDPVGYHRVMDSNGRPGDRYQFRLASGQMFPDPASRAQAGDVHGPSLVVDPSAYPWHDDAWCRPLFRDLVIYELHIGTFTADGTFRAAIDKLQHLRDLGVNAIELMPIADFPGSRNWGYDGVLIYAPARAYGRPDDLRALVDAAHDHGIAVILDVVYNHLGPDGNYVGQFSRAFFSDRHETPWGSGFNFDGRMSRHVRDFFAQNPVYWMRDYHIDGFRIDATHTIRDVSKRHIFRDMTVAIHERGGYAIAEDERNEALLGTPTAKGGFGFDAVWADDFHHVVRVSQTGEMASYFRDYQGTLEELIDTLQHGWLYRGQVSAVTGRSRGTQCQDLPPQEFIHCISNHDQVGNRAFGGRISQRLSPDGYRAISMLLCLTPYTPMLFMGQEWAASTPFLFFCDHKQELGREITQGRLREFAAFPEFAEGAELGQIPDPQAQETFLGSKLDWDEVPRPEHGEFLDLYRECLRLRQAIDVFRPCAREGWEAAVTKFGAGAIRFEGEAETFLLLFHLGGEARGSLLSEPVANRAADQEWHLLLSSNDRRFGGSGQSAFDACTQHCSFAARETLLLKTARKKPVE